MWSREDVGRMCDALVATRIKSVKWHEVEDAIESAKKFRIDAILIAFHHRCQVSVGVAFMELLEEYFRDEEQPRTKGIAEVSSDYEKWMAANNRPLYLPASAKIDSGEVS